MNEFLCYIPGVSIFSLKEIQLQKDPGFRNSTYPETGMEGSVFSHICKWNAVPETFGTEKYFVKLVCVNVPKQISGIICSDSCRDIEVKCTEEGKFY